MPTVCQRCNLRSHSTHWYRGASSTLICVIQCVGARASAVGKQRVINRLSMVCQQVCVLTELTGAAVRRRDSSVFFLPLPCEANLFYATPELRFEFIMGLAPEPMRLARNAVGYFRLSVCLPTVQFVCNVCKLTSFSPLVKKLTRQNEYQNR